MPEELERLGKRQPDFQPREVHLLEADGGQLQMPSMLIALSIGLSQPSGPDQDLVDEQR